MAEALGAAGSIVGIAAFGLQLSNTLRIYVEALIDYEDSIWDISLHIEATASALQRLHGLIQNDRTAPEGASASLLKKDGLDEITSLSTQCKRVYEEIAVLITKAAGQYDKKGKGQGGQVDLNILKNTTLYHRMRWPWLEPQIRKKQSQLRSIQNHILFYMNVVQLGQAMMSVATGTAQDPKKAVEFRSAARALKKKMNVYGNAPTQRSTPPMPLEEPFPISSSLTSSFLPTTVEDPEPKTTPILRLDTPSSTHSPTGIPRSVSPVRITPRYSTGLESYTQSPPTPVHREASPLSNGAAYTPQPQPSAQRTLQSSGAPHDSSFSFPGTAPPPQVAEATGPSGPPTAGLPMLPSDLNSQLKRKKRWSLISTLKSIFQYSFHVELECYLLSHADAVPHKLLLEQWTLRRFVTQLGVSYTPWTENLSLLANWRQPIEENLRNINKAHHCPRSCVAVHSFEPASSDKTHLLVFLSIGKPVKPLYFRLPDGGEFEFIFESCRLWKDMLQTLISILPAGSTERDLVSLGFYALTDEKGRRVAAATWDSTIQPGLLITMTWRLERAPVMAEGLVEPLSQLGSNRVPPYRARENSTLEGLYYTVPHIPPPESRASLYMVQHKARPAAAYYDRSSRYDPPGPDYEDFEEYKPKATSARMPPTPPGRSRYYSPSPDHDYDKILTRPHGQIRPFYCLDAARPTGRETEKETEEVVLPQEDMARDEFVEQHERITSRTPWTRRPPTAPAPQPVRYRRQSVADWAYDRRVRFDTQPVEDEAQQERLRARLDAVQPATPARPKGTRRRSHWQLNGPWPADEPLAESNSSDTEGSALEGAAATTSSEDRDSTVGGEEKENLEIDLFLGRWTNAFNIGLAGERASL